MKPTTRRWSLPLFVIAMVGWLGYGVVREVMTGRLPLGAVVTIGAFAAVLMLPLAAYLLSLCYVMLFPAAASPWHDRLGAVLSPAGILTFRLMRVSLAEAARLGNLSPADHRWMRRYERRSGIRFNETESVGRGMPVVGLLRGLLVSYRRTHRKGRRIRDIDPGALRAIAILSVLGREQTTTPFRIHDAAVRLLAHKDMRPEDAVGWALAYPVAADAGWVPAGDPLPGLQSLYPGAPGVPGWLFVLAGVGPGETLSTDVDTAGLLTLAALRGQPLHWLDLVRGDRTDLPVAAPMGVA